MSVRAGIVVTGTEVLVRHRRRPQRPVAVRAAARARRRARAHRGRRRPAGRRAGGARLPRARGRRPDRHLGRARADRGRPHGRGRRRVRRPADGARRGARGADPGDPAAQPRALALLQRGGDARGQPQAGDRARGRDDPRAGRHRARAGRPARRRGRAARRRAARAAGRAAADVGVGGADRAAARRCSRGAGTLEQRMLRLFGVPGVRDRARACVALEREGVAARPAGDHDLPAARARSRSPRCSRPRRRADYDAFAAGIRARHGDTLFSEDGSTIDEQVAGAARRPDDRGGGVVHRRADGGRG